MRELERDYSLLCGERDRGSAAVDNYSKILSERDSVILSLEREVAGLKSRVDNLGQHVADKEEVSIDNCISLVFFVLIIHYICVHMQVISRATALRAAAEASKKEADERTDVYKSAVDAMQLKLLKATEEMQRGNEVTAYLCYIDCELYN